MSAYRSSEKLTTLYECLSKLRKFDSGFGVSRLYPKTFCVYAYVYIGIFIYIYIYIYIYEKLYMEIQMNMSIVGGGYGCIYHRCSYQLLLRVLLGYWRYIDGARHR